jgi:hypothetical protein
MDLCKYKNIFGEPNTGNHKIRDPIFNTALVDIIFTVLGAFIISYTFQYKFITVLLILFILGIILHRIFCVRTTIDKFLFPNAS